MINFLVEATVDTVCPWCYLGKRKLELGIAAYKQKYPASGDTFTTTWKPFYLNPNSPSPGIPKREYLGSRFGDDKVPMMEARLDSVGKPIGINFKFGGNTGNTRDSHRLILLAKEKAGADVQTKVVDEVEKSYFENEGDITSRAMLVAAAGKAGLDEAEVNGWLSSDAGGIEVDKEVRVAQARGVSGVPNFILQDRYEIGGAQDPDSFVTIFEKIKQAEGK